MSSQNEVLFPLMTWLSSERVWGILCSTGKMGGDRICKKLMTMQIQVYVEIVPPFANETRINIKRKQVSLAEHISPCAAEQLQA